MPRKPTVSKSSFIRGKQCLKSLYLIKKNPELRDAFSVGQQSIFNRSHHVCELALQLFPCGEEASFDLPQGFAQYKIFPGVDQVRKGNNSRDNQKNIIAYKINKLSCLFTKINNRIISRI